MLLKDGVRYFPYEYSSEEELEKIVFEHYKEIFGTDSLLFDSHLMTNSIGKTYDEALKIAAKKLKLGADTLRHLCTINIGLTSEQLRKIITSREKVKQLLNEKFPDYIDEINKALP